MLKNYLVLALRQLRKHSLYSLINILGLSFGIAIFLVLWCYIRFETSFNSFHEKANRLYVLNTTLYSLNMDPFTAWDVAPAMRETIPGIAEVARIHWDHGILSMKLGGRERSSAESGMLYADNSIFSMFTFELVAGDLSRALSQPYTTVLSKSVALKFFPDAHDAIGKTISMRGEWMSADLLITAVVEDAPKNSTQGFASFVSIDPLIHNEFYQTERRWNNFITWIELEDPSAMASVNEAFPRFISEYKSGENLTYEPEMLLTPITDIHLSHNDPRQGKDMGNIYLFIIVAAIIIVIAWVNYINLSTARAIERAREVGVKKALGVLRKQLVVQFMTESFVVNLISIVMAAILAKLFMPILNQLADRQLSLGLTNPGQLIILSSLLLFGTLVSGVYPALILSSFRTTDVIKGVSASSSGQFSLRKGLIVFQFSASLCLLICTSAIIRQVWFMEAGDKGVSTEQVLVVPGPDEANVIENADKLSVNFKQRTLSFKNKLLSLPSVERVSTSGVVPGGSYNHSTHVDVVDKPAEETTPGENTYSMFTDFDFIDTYRMTVVAGRKWDTGKKTDYDNVLVNEAFVSGFGLGTNGDALDKKIVWMKDTMNIIGVIRNFYWESLKVEHHPIVMMPTEVYPRRTSILIHGDIQETIESVRSLYIEYFPGTEFNYLFADEYYNEMYASDLRFGQIFGIFTAFAIGVACLGLFGMATFTTHQRSREISIRKVLGASITNIMVLLSTQFGKLLLIAFVISTPLSWYAVRSWLEGYPVRVGISISMFAIPSVALLLMLMASVVLQVYRGANVNPAKVLRS